MRVRYFGGIADGNWVTLEHPSRQVWLAEADMGRIYRHRYWRYGNRLVWAGRDGPW